MIPIDELVAILGFETRGEQNLKRFQDGLDRASKGLDKFAAAAAKWGAVLGTAMATGMVALGKNVISTTAQFEQYEAALETIEGSAEKARSSMDWIAQFARQTPYDLSGVTEAFTKLKTYGIDPLADDALRTLGDTASAMNKPLNQAVEALADATTFQFERLREFGLVASQKGDEVTFKWQRNGAEMTKIVKKNGEEIRRFLLDNFGERFSGAMLRQSTTWNGMLSNLGDSWEQFQVKIGRGGFFDAVKNRLADFLDRIDELDADGTLDRWSKTLSNGFERVIGTVEIAVERLWQVGGKIASLFGSDSAIWGLTAFAAALLARAFPLTVGITAIVLALEDLVAFFEGKKSLIGDWLKEHPQIEAALRSLGETVGTLAEKLGPIAEYIVPVLGFAGALVLLAPAIRAVTSALLTLTGIKLAWSVLAFLAGMAGVGGSAGTVSRLATSIGTLSGALNSLAVAGSAAAASGVLGFLARLTGIGLGAMAGDALGRFVRSIGEVIGGKFYTTDDPVALEGMRQDADERQEQIDRTRADAHPGFKDLIGYDPSEPATSGQQDFNDIQRNRIRASERVQGVRPTIPSPFDPSAIKGAIQRLVDGAAGLISDLADSMPVAAQAAAANAGGGQFDRFLAGMENVKAWNGKLSSEASARAVVQDNSTVNDNRQYPVTVNSTVNQTVQQATQAPAAAAQATSQAVGRAAAPPARRITGNYQ